MKLTDIETVKALEICANDEIDLCTDCPYLVDDCCTGYHNRENFVTAVLDLIKRKDAKIEDMQKVIQSVMAANVRLINEVGKAKDEAFKEFAEMLKEKYRFYGAIGKSELYEDIDSLARKK